MKLILISLAILGLASCTSGKKVSCAKKNSTQLGFSDGKKGFPEEHGLETQKTCKSEGIDISMVDYKSGWIKGIQQYCSPENAFSMGKEGNESKIDNCPVELKSAFSKNYDRGKRFNELGKKMNKFEKDIEGLEKKKERLKATIKETNKDIAKIDKKIDSIEEKKISIKKAANNLSSKEGLDYIILE